MSELSEYNKKVIKELELYANERYIYYASVKGLPSETAITYAVMDASEYIRTGVKR